MPAISKASMATQAKLDHEETQRLKHRAARQAAAVVTEEVPDLVDIRILPMGDGKVSMGIHVAGIGDAHYEKGEIAKGWIRENAEALELRGFAEILPPEPTEKT